MYKYIHKKSYLIITYFLPICLLLVTNQPLSAFGDSIPCICDTDAERDRLRMATILVGATTVALIGGIAYAASVSGHKCRGHSYCGCSYYPYSCYSSYSRCAHYSYSNRSYPIYTSFPSSLYTNYSSLSPSDIIDTDINAADQFGPLGPPVPAGVGVVGLGGTGITTVRAATLSGSFFSIPISATRAQGNVTAFIQLPDGTQEFLGSLPLSNNKSSSLPYGPFHQNGTYTFGIRVNESIILPTQAKIGGVDVNVDGTTMETYEFIIPSNPPSHYDLPTHSYTLL